MAKTRISSADLTWVITEKLRSFEGCGNVSIAVIPTADGWEAVTPRKEFQVPPVHIGRIAEIQKQLRRIYALRKD